MLQHSTGAVEYLILYTGTWTRQANSSFILTFRPTLLEILNSEIISCERCPRLRRHSAEVAQLKRRAYRDQTYWGLPVPSFGDPAARVLILGLAPGAHGSNRTGRMFTGDRSGEILYKVLHKTGFASHPTSVSREDGLTLHDLYITAAAHCAPPGQQTHARRIAQLPPLLRARTGTPAQPEGGSGPRQDRVRRLPGHSEIPRPDRQPRAFHFRPRCAVSDRRRINPS